MDGDSEIGAIAGQIRQASLHERNCRETLVFGLDLSPELCERRSGNSSDTRLQYVTSCLSNYVHVRSRLHPQHRYGLMVLAGEEAAWAVQPVSSHEEFQTALQVFVSEVLRKVRANLLKDGDGVQLMTLLSRLGRDCTAPPNEVLRLIMVYTHSELFPDISPAPPAVMQTDNFFMDMLYLYDSAKESPQTIVDMLTQSIDNHLSQAARGYTYTVKWDVLRERLPECLAYLMAHPLQRPMETLLGRYELQQQD